MVKKLGLTIVLGIALTAGGFVSDGLIRSSFASDSDARVSSGGAHAATHPTIPPMSEIAPEGANDFSCEGRPGRRTPVVLLHGMMGQMSVWRHISPVLADRGYCVFATNLPKRFTARLQRSARVVRSFVNRVRRATGSQRVSIVGHSMAGGPLPRLYIKRFGGRGKVRDVIGLGPGNHGILDPFTHPPISTPGFPCQSCPQFTTGSHFLRKLNRGTEIPFKRVDYTVLQTFHDPFVTPHYTGFLRGPRSRVSNIRLEDRCPGLMKEEKNAHFALLNNGVVQQWILSALRRPGPADPGFRPTC
jgi:pimeloyl-ACP methyl ester carboxylesterase